MEPPARLARIGWSLLVADVMTERALRPLSWVFAIAALVGPPAWAWWMSHLDREEQRAAGAEFFCGNGLFAYLVLAGLTSAVLSVVAVTLGGWAYRALPKPRPVMRAWELALLAVPLVFAGVVGALVVVAVW